MDVDNPESYMDSQQLGYFKKKLLAWEQDILGKLQAEVGEATIDVEFMDVATTQATRETMAKEYARQQHTLRNIEKALGRIADGSYGYCGETGEPIGIGRLEANPIATLSIEAQTFREKRNKVRI